MSKATYSSFVKIPEILPGETADHYRDRLAEELEARYTLMCQEAENDAVKTRESIDRFADYVRACLQEEIDWENYALSRVKREMLEEKAKCDDLKNKRDILRAEMDQLVSQISVMQSEFDQQEVERAEKQRKFEVGIEIIRKTDPEMADQIMRDYNEATALAIEHAAETKNIPED